jgi:hypothetical protein
MFVIVYNNQVVLGPMHWNRFRFENFLEEEYEISLSLPKSNTDTPLVFSDQLKFLPIQTTPNPTYNPRIEMLQGPFWQFTDTHAISSYQVEPLAVEAVKNTLKAEAATHRWNIGNSKIEIIIADKECKFSTDRDTINLLNNALMASATSFNWKLDSNSWVTLTNTELQSILDAISVHIQTGFDSEYTKIAEIDAATTLSELNSIEIVPVGVI